jgi:hypothetical protein
MEQTLQTERRMDKTANLVHSLLTHIKKQPGQHIQIVTPSRLTMEHLARVVFFTAGFPKYALPVKEVVLGGEVSMIFFENGTEVSFSLVVPEQKES